MTHCALTPGYPLPCSPAPPLVEVPPAPDLNLFELAREAIDANLAALSPHAKRASDVADRAFIEDFCNWERIEAMRRFIVESPAAAIAAEIGQITETIKSVGTTQSVGRYICAGSKTTAPPYTPGGADAYAGDTAALQREIGPGVQVPLNVDGASVIGDGSTAGSLLATLRQISTDLKANNSTALQGGDLSALDTANAAVTTAQATVGARTDRLSTALTRLQQLQESTTQLLSTTEDADMAQAAVNFSQQQVAYQAALKAGAQIIQPSLMDFLH